MANRLNAPNQFETLSPPWILSQLDTNFTQNQAAWNDSSLGFVNGIPVDTGSANAYTVALPFGSPSAYQDGMPVVWIPAHSNTGASTITVSPLGSVAILSPAGNALLGGEIIINRPLTIVYKSAVPTGFRIVSPCPANVNFGTVGASQTLECAGCTSVFASATFNASGLNITLNHLAPGATVTLFIQNSSGSSGTYAIGATDPSGTTYTGVFTVFAQAGGVPSNILNGTGTFGLPNGQAVVLSGQAVGLTLYLTA